MLSGYWIDVSTSVGDLLIVALGLGMLMGRVGLVSLGQIARAGARRAGWRRGCCFATGAAVPARAARAGLITMVLGTLVGLPALRLSGLYLALITLMLAGAITVALQRRPTSPTAAAASSGHTESDRGAADPAPAIATTDTALLPLRGRRRGDHVPARAAARARASPGGPGRRSARANPPRWPPA